MGRARVGVPPGERRLRATHVERVGAATGWEAAGVGWPLGRGVGELRQVLRQQPVLPPAAMCLLHVPSSSGRL